MDFTERLGCTVKAAEKAGMVIPAFNVPYLPMVEAVCAALAQHRTLGMVQVAKLELVKFESRSLKAVAEEYRRYADPRYVSLHLDHVPVIDEDGLKVDWHSLIKEALDLGYHSVMIDGSRLPLDENIKVTAETVRMAHQYGVLAEAELGAVLGHEAGPLPPYEELFESKRGFTDPADAEKFVQETDVDWLSVSVGSIHGAISPSTKDKAKIQARLDIDHLKLLRKAAAVPLVLHGGSGIKQECIDQAVQNGICKINIATDIRQPYERCIAASGSVEDAQQSVVDVMARLIKLYNIEGSADKLSNLVTVA